MLLIYSVKDSYKCEVRDGGTLASTDPSGFGEESPFPDHANQRGDLRALIHALMPVMPAREALRVAKTLLETHGSFPGAVLGRTPVADERAAAVLASIRIALKYMTRRTADRRKRMTRRSAIAYFRSQLVEGRADHTCVLYMDSMNHLLGVAHQTGTIGTVQMYGRELARQAFELGATRFYLGRSHTGGPSKPDASDMETIGEIEAALTRVNILMIDYIAVGLHDFYSFRDDAIDALRTKFVAAHGLS